MDKPFLSMEPDETTVEPSGLTSIKRAAHITLGPPTEWLLQSIKELLAKTNKRGVAFKNFIALPETLLACGARYTDGGETIVDFSLLLTRGVCENGQKQFVGWNRIFIPLYSQFRRHATKRPQWEVEDANGEIRVLARLLEDEDSAMLYPYAEDVGGFQKLWA